MHIEEANLTFLSLNYTNEPTKIILHQAGISHCSIYDLNSMHKKKRMSGIGYHYFIQKDGSVLRGRREEAQGGHCAGQNRSSIGICFEGDYNKDTMPKEQIQGGIDLIDEIRNRRGNLPVLGSNKFLDKDSLGKNFPLYKFDEEKVIGNIEENFSEDSEVSIEPLEVITEKVEEKEIISEQPVITIEKVDVIKTITKEEDIEEDNEYSISYGVYIQDLGWQPIAASDGETAGLISQKKRIEAFNVDYNGPGNIEFQCFFSNSGWQSIRYAGEIAGTIGKENKIIEAISIEIKDSDKKVEYRVYLGNGWMPWVSGGVMAGNIGRGQVIEAIEIKLA